MYDPKHDRIRNQLKSRIGIRKKSNSRSTTLLLQIENCVWLLQSVGPAVRSLRGLFLLPLAGDLSWPLPCRRLPCHCACWRSRCVFGPKIIFKISELHYGALQCSGSVTVWNGSVLNLQWLLGCKNINFSNFYCFIKSFKIVICKWWVKLNF